MISQHSVHLLAFYSLFHRSLSASVKDYENGYEKQVDKQVDNCKVQYSTVYLNGIIKSNF